MFVHVYDGRAIKFKNSKHLLLLLIFVDPVNGTNFRVVVMALVKVKRKNSLSITQLRFDGNDGI